MIRTSVFLAASLVAGWFAFAVVSSIDMADVVAYNNIEKHVGTETLKAGDVVAFSPFGTEPSLLCSMDLEAGVLREVPISNRYVNGLTAALPRFADMVDWAAGMFGGGQDGNHLGDHSAELRFVGRLSAFSSSNATPPMSRDCACEVVANLLQRAQVCTVKESLIESTMVSDAAGSDPVRRERTVGITLRARPFLIGDFAQLDCPKLAGTANFEMRQPAEACSTGPERSFDVALRRSMRVIHEQALASQP